MGTYLNWYLNEIIRHCPIAKDRVGEVTYRNLTRVENAKGGATMFELATVILFKNLASEFIQDVARKS